MTDAWVDGRAETIRRAVGEAKDEILVTAPDLKTVRGLSLVEDVEWPRNVRLLTTKPRVKELRRDFLTATRIADLVRDGTLEVRTTMADETPLQPLLVTSDDVTCLLLPGEDDVAAVRTDDDEVFPFVRGQYLSIWGDAQSFDLGTPAYSTILRTVGEQFDDPMQTDVETMLQSSLATRAFDERLDEIHAVLLVAARHGQQYYDVSQWGERIGLGSPAKFSNRKQDLEDAGLLDTEKIQTGTVGRPRQRLVLADSNLEDASVQDLVAAAQSVMPK